MGDSGEGWPSKRLRVKALLLAAYLDAMLDVGQFGRLSILPAPSISGDPTAIGKQALSRAWWSFRVGAQPLVVLTWLIHAIRCLDLAETSAEIGERQVIPTSGAEG